LASDTALDLLDFTDDWRARVWVLSKDAALNNLSSLPEACRTRCRPTN